MNILHVLNISFVIPYFLGKQLSFFSQKGYKEYIICSSSKELNAFAEVYGFKYKEVDILRKISIWKDLKAIILVMGYIRANRIDVVTGHTPKGALIAMLAAYILRVPVRIYFRHGLVYETSIGVKRKMLMLIDRIAAKLATKVVCVSPSVCKRSIEDNLNSANKQYLLSKGTCNGIDVKRFSIKSIDENRLQELKKNLGLKQTDFVIGFTGRLVRDKGIIELVHAFQELRKKYSDLVLLLVGMFEERDALPEEIVNMIKQSTVIINTGYVLNSNIEYYYALMDLFVLPSYREGFPTSILEASSMNLPILTTRVTGCIDAIVEGRTGLFVEHDYKSISSAIELLYLDEHLRLSYGCNGQKFVEDNFEQYIIWREIEKLYQYCKKK